MTDCCCSFFEFGIWGCRCQSDYGTLDSACVEFAVASAPTSLMLEFFHMIPLPKLWLLLSGQSALGTGDGGQRIVFSF